MLVDHLGQMLVEPLLENRPEHLAHHVLERIDLRRGGDRRGHGLKLLERVAALTGDLVVDQRRAEVDRPRQRLVELKDVIIPAVARVFGKRLVVNRADGRRLERDGAVGNRGYVLMQPREIGASDKITVLPYDIKHSDYLLAVSQKSTHIRDRAAFLASFDGCLKQLEKDGRLAKLRASYGLE